jgi:hypothetical protein
MDLEILLVAAGQLQHNVDGLQTAQVWLGQGQLDNIVVEPNVGTGFQLPQHGLHLRVCDLDPLRSEPFPRQDEQLSAAQGTGLLQKLQDVPLLDG